MVTTASIVARLGWIIPAPLAIPPTVKPSARRRRAVFGPLSVVRIASAAASPPPGESAAAAASTPAEELLHRQPRADHAGREDDDLLGPEPEARRDPLGRGARVLLARRCRSRRSRRRR